MSGQSFSIKILTNEADDALRVKVKPAKTDQFVETFTINPEKDGVAMSWENTKVKFKVTD